MIRAEQCSALRPPVKAAKTVSAFLCPIWAMAATIKMSERSNRLYSCSRAYVEHQRSEPAFAELVLPPSGFRLFRRAADGL